MGGLADRLHNDVDGTLLGPGPFDGERNALALFVNSEDYELSGLVFARDPRSLDYEPLYVGSDELGIKYFEHELPRTALQDIVSGAAGGAM
jgi:hypothetical protein